MTGQPSCAARALANEHLVRAVRAADFAEVEAALAAGADPDTPGPAGTPVLATAAWVKSDWTTTALLIEHGADIHLKMLGETLLHLFARHNQIDLARCVLERGMPIDIPTERDPAWTPLMVAASWGQEAMVAVLLELRAHVTAQDPEGITALHLASSPSIAARLLAAGAAVDASSDNGSTPLMFHARNGRTSSCQTLLQHGAHVNIVDNTDATALVDAAATGQAQIAALLLEHGADPSLGSIKGQDFQWYCARDPALSIVFASWRAQQAMRQVLRERSAPQREVR